MDRNAIFNGAATALITPFKDGQVDYENFGKLIDWQIDQGIDGLVICGTTGEGSTLSDSEHKKAFDFALDKIAGRIPAIAGTGSNDTAYAIELTQYASKIGYDAALLVTPYYNKATQKGLVESFTAIADKSDIPCLLYNVPSRTGVNILPETCAELAKHPQIFGIKEASGDISQIMKIKNLCGEDFDIYSGNDDQIYPVLALGGKGVISVLSNIYPKETSKMCHRFFNGNWQESLKMQLDYYPLIDALFCEVNPIPVKAAMAHLGFCQNELRLPLTTMNKEKEAAMIKLLQK